MLTLICPKLPMRNKATTKVFYTKMLGFSDIGIADYEGYLILEKDAVEIHFFEYPTLNLKENYGQVYIRVQNIKQLYATYLHNNVAMHPNGALSIKPWGQLEFSLLDPDNNLLTFGEDIAAIV